MLISAHKSVKPEQPMIKKIAALTCCLLLPMLAHAGDAPPALEGVTPELQQKFSYAIGRDISKSLQTVRDVVSLDVLKQGLDDGAASKPGPYSDAEMQAAKTQMGQILQERMRQETIALSANNLKSAEEFLAKNGKRKGVITTASGLQYEVLTNAKGDHPTAASYVTVHYRGTLADGKEFDSSYARNTPATFQLQAVIPAWTEGVQLMAKGAKYKFYVPPALGYGERGAGEWIGPNALLIFEVELLAISDTPPAQ